MYLNDWTLIGRITKTPEVRYTQGGKAVCTVRLAVDRGVTGTNGEKETDFIDAVLWEKQAEFVANYGGKGRLLLVKGRGQYREWDKQDGTKGHTTELVATMARFMDQKREEAGGDE